jgi:hypothetical protein
VGKGAFDLQDGIWVGALWVMRLSSYATAVAASCRASGTFTRLMATGRFARRAPNRRKGCRLSNGLTSNGGGKGRTDWQALWRAPSPSGSGDGGEAEHDVGAAAPDAPARPSRPNRRRRVGRVGLTAEEIANLIAPAAPSHEPWIKPLSSNDVVRTELGLTRYG